MTDFKEYRDQDGVGLADLIRRREVSAGEVLDAAIARTEEVNPTINAVRQLWLLSLTNRG